LEGYGIQSKLIQWISDFLHGRTEYVNVNGCTSETVQETSGVPQGSVLGPTLFVYYINDLPSMVDCDIKMFADDTQTYSVVNSVKQKENLQKCINKLTKWTDDWLLKFNQQ
jgi:hypothetical protein